MGDCPKNMISYYFNGKEDDGITFFFQKSFALVNLKIYQFNTYKKLRRVRSIVSRMVHYPAALLVTIER